MVVKNSNCFLEQLMDVEDSNCFLEQLDGCGKFLLFLGTAGWLRRIPTVSWISWLVVEDNNCFLEQLDGCDGF